MSKKFTRDDVDKFVDNDIYLPTRTIYIGTVSTDSNGDSAGVDYAMAERAVKNLHILDSLAPSGDQPIKIILNTEGGDWIHGMAIYDAIKKCNNHVTIIVSGQAMSMGSVILQAADERLMDENSKFMIHHGQNGVNDNVHNVYRWIEDSKKGDAKMEEIFLEKILQVHPDFKQKKLQDLLKFDTILTAAETVKMGLADGVVVGYNKILRREQIGD